MRKQLVVYAAAIVIGLFPVLHALGQDAASPAAPSSQEGAKIYGNKGTLEIGLTGSAGSTALSGTIKVNGSTQATYPSTNYLANMSLFAKYFLIEGFHIGGALQAQGNLGYDNSGTLQNGGGNFGLFGQAGYTFRLSPIVQLDLTGGLGEMAEFYSSWTPFWCFTLMAQPMLLFPIGQNAVIGVGSLIMAMFVNGQINDYQQTDTLKIDATAVSANGVVQVSIYF